MPAPKTFRIAKVEGARAIDTGGNPRVELNVVAEDGTWLILDLSAREAGLLRDYANQALDFLKGG